MPYRLKPRFRDSVNMELDLVIGSKALERIATPYKQTVLNFKIHIITAPAPPSSSEVERPDEGRLGGDRVSSHVNMENLIRAVRRRSSTIQLAVRKAPKVPWNYPFALGGRAFGTPRQPQWFGDNRPFAKDVYDLGSNNDWVNNDFAIRAAQIKEWAVAKQAREVAFQTTVPDANFTPVAGLAQCQVYIRDANPEWYEQNLSGAIMADYEVAKKITEDAFIRYNQALYDWKASEQQNPQTTK